MQRNTSLIRAPGKSNSFLNSLACVAFPLPIATILTPLYLNSINIELTSSEFRSSSYISSKKALRSKQCFVSLLHSMQPNCRSIITRVTLPTTRCNGTLLPRRSSTWMSNRSDENGLLYCPYRYTHMQHTCLFIVIFG